MKTSKNYFLNISKIVNTHEFIRFIDMIEFSFNIYAQNKL